MADYPEHGETPWDLALKAYIEDLPNVAGPFRTSLIALIESFPTDEGAFRNALIDLIADEADANTAALIENPASLTSIALLDIYASKSIETIIDTGRLSESAIEEAVQPGQDALAVQNNGRLNDSLLSQRFGETARYLPYKMFDDCGIGTPAVVTLASAIKGWAMDKSTQEAITGSGRVPNVWDKFSVVVHGYSTVPAGGNVVLRCLWREQFDGTDLSAITTDAKTSLVTFAVGSPNLRHSARLFSTGVARNTGGEHMLRILRVADDVSDTLDGDFVITSVDLVPLSFVDFQIEDPPVDPDPSADRLFTEAMNDDITAGITIWQIAPPPPSDVDTTYPHWPANVIATGSDFTASTWSGGDVWAFPWGNRQNYSVGQSNDQPNYLWGAAFTHNGQPVKSALNPDGTGLEIRTTFDSIKRANLATRMQVRHLLGLNLTTPSYHNVVVQTAPDIYWRLNDSVGTTNTADLGTAALLGTVLGNPVFEQAGLIVDGKGLLFDGTTDRVQRAFTAVDTSAAVAALIKMPSIPAAEQVIGGRYSNTAASEVLYIGIDTTGKPFASARNTAGAIHRATGPSVLPTNTARLIVGKMEDATLKLYVEGVLVASTAFVGTLNNATTSVSVGGRTSTDTNSYIGTIAEFAYWSGTPPTDPEIALMQTERIGLSTQWTNDGADGALIITEATAKANRLTYFTEPFEVTKGNLKGTTFRVAKNTVILPTQRLVDGPLPSRNKGIAVDYECADGRTEAETLAFWRGISADVRGVGKKSMIYTNPLYTGITARHGLGENWSSVIAAVDYFTIMLARDSSALTFAQRWANSIAELGTMTTTKWSKAVIGFGMGNDDFRPGTETTLEDAQYVRSLLVAGGSDHPFHLIVWRYYAELDPDKASAEHIALYRQKLSWLAFGTLTPPP